MYDRQFYMGDNFMRNCSLSWNSQNTEPEITITANAADIKAFNTIEGYLDNDINNLEAKIKELEEKIAAVLPKQIGFKRAPAFNIDKWKYEVL